MNDIWGIVLAVILIVGILALVLFKVQQWALKRMDKQNSMIASSKQSATIFVIDKKKDKLANANLPKGVLEQVPKMQRGMKMPLVKAKVGAQFVTLIADKNVYESLPLKKNVKVEIAGIYIVSMKGMKTKEELKEIKKRRKEDEKNKK